MNSFLDYPLTESEVGHVQSTQPQLFLGCVTSPAQHLQCTGERCNRCFQGEDEELQRYQWII